ncbi:MAG: hypothetical protein ABJL67_02675 [Sulfitobacter sp.]
MHSDPRAIYQEHLDEVNAAVLAHDPASILDRFTYPRFVGGLNGGYWQNSAEDVMRCLLSYSQRLAALGVTRIERVCLDAKQPEENLILGYHETYLLAGLQLIEEPFMTEIVMRRVDGLWKSFRSQSAISSKEPFFSSEAEGTPGPAPRIEEALDGVSAFDPFLPNQDLASKPIQPKKSAPPTDGA